MGKNNQVIKNASWIIVCRVIQSLMSLIIGMISARYLGPSNYGLINYAASIVAFVVPIAQLGLRNTLVQEIVSNRDSEGETLGTSLAMSTFTSLLGIVGIIGFVSIVNRNETETIIVCSLYSVSIVFQMTEMIQYWYQAKLLSKYTSITSLIAYFGVSIYRVYLLATAKSIYWFAISNAIDYAIISLVLLVIYKKLGNQKLSFSLSAAKRLFGKGKYYIVSSMMVTIFAQTARIMLKFMINNEAVGYYSVAVACAGMTSFVFFAILDSARPVIFESKKNSQQQFEKNITRLYSVIIYFALAQSVFISIFSGTIVKILYGSQYMDSVMVLRIIVWYTTFSYLGSVRNIWILAEGKHKILWVLNLAGALLNVILSFIFIPVWGINGAAITALLTQIFTNVLLGFIIKPIRYNNKLMIKGLNIKNLTNFLRKTK